MNAGREYPPGTARLRLLYGRRAPAPRLRRCAPTAPLRHPAASTGAAWLRPYHPPPAAPLRPDCAAAPPSASTGAAWLRPYHPPPAAPLRPDCAAAPRLRRCAPTAPLRHPAASTGAAWLRPDCAPAPPRRQYGRSVAAPRLRRCAPTAPLIVVLIEVEPARTIAARAG
jgi:hypothetical protein